MLENIFDPISNTSAPYVDLSIRTAAPLEGRENLLHAVLGIADELLELFEFFNTQALDMNDAAVRENLIKELGDVTWFTALYASWVIQTEGAPAEFAQAKFQSLWDKCDPLTLTFFTAITKSALHARVCVGLVKKEYAYKKPIPAEVTDDLFVQALNVVNVFCLTLGISIEDVLTRNIAKLSERYKAATFTQQEAVERDESKE